MAQNRSQQPQPPGVGGVAFNPGVVLRLGRAAREQLNHAANDNRATLLRRLLTLAVRAGIAAAIAYVAWRAVG